MESQPSDESHQTTTANNVTQRDPVCKALAANVRRLVLPELEAKYTWMSKAGARQIVEKVALALEDGIMAQKPLIAASKARISFFSLSKELREAIYIPVLADHGDRIGKVEISISPGKSSYGSSSSSWASDFPRDSLRVPALLQKSRQIRKETEFLYYSTTEFTTDWPLNEFYYGLPADIAQRWLNHIGLRCRDMIRKFVVVIDWRGSAVHDEFEKRMRVMANGKKSESFDNPYGFHREYNSPWPEIVTFPRMLRTTMEWILEYIELDTSGLGERVVEIRYGSGYNDDGPGEVISRTEVFCPFCYGRGKPDSAEFLGGVCVDCTSSRAEGSMQVGSWRQSDRF